jgi:hypothetical protein
MRLRVAFVGLAFAGSAVAVASIEARQAGAPLPPTLLPASVVNTVVGLAWTANATGGAPTGYQLQAGSSPGASDIAILTVAAFPTTFVTAAPPGTYYVRVVAFNGLGASLPSNEIVVTVGGGGSCQGPGIPTGLTAAPFVGGVTLSWNAPSTGGVPTGYALLVGSASGAVNLGTFPVGLTTTLTSPAPNGQYFVRVVALNGCGTSAPSTAASFVVGGGGGALSVPAGFYVGTVLNFTRTGVAPITSFTLQLNQPVPAGSTVQTLSARWTDNRGCVKTTGIIGFTTSTGPTISLENFSCNDGDFGLRVTSVNGTVYSGACLNGGPNCTFQMTRQ